MIYVWGSGGNGQLGLGNTDDYSTPQLMCVEPGVQLIPSCIVSGGCHSAALVDQDNTTKLFLWGDNENAQLASCPQQHALHANPVQVQIPKLQENAQVEMVSCGWTHSVAVVSTSDVLNGCTIQLYTWGSSENHKLGRQNPTDGRVSHVPTPVSSFPPSTLRIVSISCGWKHSLIALNDGSVWSWGTGRNGELGLGALQLTATHPTCVFTDKAVSKVYCGWQHSVVYHGQEGVISLCGKNQHGQLGVPKTQECKRFRLQTMDKFATIMHLSVGWHFVVCLLSSRELVSWGKGSHGQLGHGHFESCNIPSRMDTSLMESSPKAVECGSEHILVVTENGRLYSCGWNEHGNLGHGDNMNRAVLTPVDYFRDHGLMVKKIAAGGAVSIAVASAQ